MSLPEISPEDRTVTEATIYSLLVSKNTEIKRCRNALAAMIGPAKNAISQVGSGPDVRNVSGSVKVVARQDLAGAKQSVNCLRCLSKELSADFMRRL